MRTFSSPLLSAMSSAPWNNPQTMKVTLLSLIHISLFPDMCRAVLDESIIGRAQAKGLLDIRCHQIRDYTLNKQKQVDDYP